MNKTELDKFISRIDYVTPLRYVSGRIVEYDIRSANITMLYKYGLINDEYYSYLNKLPKYNREVDVGLLIMRSSNFYNTIASGIVEAKKKLFYSNKINPDTVVRIANDAVYINSFLDLTYTKFDDVEFKVKSITSVMMRLKDLIIFYWYNENGMNIDIIGMKNSQYLHLNYMISFIAQVIYYLERVSAKEAVSFVCQFYDDYINLKLEKEFYRELNPASMYKYKNSLFYMTNIENINEIDIGYNLYLIREIYSIVLEKYNLEIRRK